MENKTGGTPNGNPTIAGDGRTVDLSQVKRGPGRPKGSKTGSGGTSANPVHSAQSTTRVENDTKVGAAFIAETGVTLLEIADETSQKIIIRKVRKAAPHRLDDVANALKDCALNDRDKKLVSASLNAIATKYTVLGKFGPEFCLVAVLAQYGVRQMRIHSLINDLVEEAKNRPRTPAATKTEEMPGPVSTPAPTP